MPLAGGPEILSEASPSSLYKIQKENKVRSQAAHARSPAPSDSRAAPPPRKDSVLVSPLTTRALGLVKAREKPCLCESWIIHAQGKRIRSLEELETGRGNPTTGIWFKASAGSHRRSVTGLHVCMAAAGPHVVLCFSLPARLSQLGSG